MIGTRTKAQRLAEMLDGAETWSSAYVPFEAAAELRRLDVLVVMLVTALEGAAEYTALLDDFTQDSIRLALEAAKEQT